MFWDLFLRRLYRTFGDVFPTSLAAGEAIATAASDRGLLAPATLNDRSLLILIQMCRPRTPLHQEAQAGYARGPLSANPGNVIALVRGECPPFFQDLLLLHRRGTPAQQALVADFLRRHFVPPLCFFLGRLYLDDPVNRVQQANACLANVLPHFDVLTRSDPTEFTCSLYRNVLNPIPKAALPNFPAAPLPPWLEQLQRKEPVEFDFLRCAQELSPVDRTAVYLSVYANLSNREIHRILEFRPYVTRQDVISRLRDGYRRIVQLF